jgi:beta-lactam-binding protein with PASTA domain
VRHIRESLTEPDGFTGMMGAGVQGTGEAPWLDFGPPVGTGQFRDGQFRDGQFRDGQFRDGQFRDGQLQGGQFAGDGFGGGGLSGGGFGGGQAADSHTLVVDRDEAARYADGSGGRHQGGGHEPLLGRWLFGPRLIIVALVIVLGVALGLGGWYLTSGRYAQVPAVSGVSVSQATAVLTADGFAVRPGQRQVHSNTVAKGEVVGTSPTGRVAKGTKVTIIVSSGPFTSQVPPVTGQTQAAAQAALQRVHLTFTIVKVGSSSPVGTVTGINPPAGTTWPQTRPVTIKVAAGLPLPSFTGMDINAAEQLASQDRVTLQQQQDNNSQQPNGIITGQNQTAGGLIQPGETVVVQVSAGPQLVAVPDPIGMSVQDATQLLESAGFQVKVNRFGFFNKVFDFSPVGQAPKGSTITLDVGF